MIRNEKGFTLIELMVVVLIIGILVAIAIPVFSNAAANAKTQACKANLRTIDGAISQYQANEGGLPPDAGNLNLLVTSGYLKQAPKDPHDITQSYGIASGAADVLVAGDGTTYP